MRHWKCGLENAKADGYSKTLYKLVAKILFYLTIRLLFARPMKTNEPLSSAEGASVRGGA
jgi:hypothetical protein